MIHFRNVSYCYPTRSAPTISGVSLDIAQGDFVLVSGPTGCGKTTFIKMLNGIIPFLSKGTLKGEITVAGKDICSSSMEELTREVGLIFQSPDDQIISNTVEEEVAFGLENLGFGAGEISQRVDWALKKTGITDLRTRDTKTLSGGQKQRVVIASQIAMRPKILAFDEPLSQLDHKGAEEVIDCICQLNREGITIVMIEHRVGDVARYVNKVFLMDKGKVAYYGDAKKSFMQALPVYKRLGVQVPQEVTLSFGLGMGKVSFSYDEIRQKFEQMKPKLCFPKPRSPAVQERGEEMHNSNDNNTDRIISLSGVDFEYVKGKKVFSGLNLDFYEGQTVALMGANGSGKSTLISLIAGIHKPVKGTVTIGSPYTNCNIAKSKNAIGMGLLIQNPDLMLFCETVEKELLFGPEHKRVNRAEALSRTNSMLGSLNLEEYRLEPPFGLSVGQRLRTALGAVLTLQPKVLLLDEPTTGQNQENIANIMLTLKKLSFIKSIVFCTHDIHTALHYADRIIVLNSGSLVFDGKVSDIFNDVDHMREYSLPVPQSVRLCKDCGCERIFFSAEELVSLLDKVETLL